MSRLRSASTPLRWGYLLLVALSVLQGRGTVSAADTATAEQQFRSEVEPLLREFCFGCHGGGEKSGNVAFDQFETTAALVGNQDLWDKALRQVRAGLMPPKDEPRPSPEQTAKLVDWIKRGVFLIDPADPDPGRVTVRRLNRTEYRNTIRDLMGIDFDTGAEFPADDTGHGFDNIGDVLTMSPLLLEKYIDAAQSIVDRAVPKVGSVPADASIAGARFHPPENKTDDPRAEGGLSLSYYKPAVVTANWHVEHPARYQVILNLGEREKFVDGMFDYNRCRVTFTIDGETLHDQEYRWNGGKSFRYEFERDWTAGDHELRVQLEPLTPDEKQVRELEVRINSVTIRGPLSEEFYVRPKDYERFFPGTVPTDADGRRQYARERLSQFATRAFRRPVDEETVTRLLAVAEGLAAQPGQTFESGIAEAMSAVLASPRFLFREEGVVEDDRDGHPRIDEYALASRLSYFFWSTMPDEELFQLAKEGKLRENLAAQVDRMLDDRRSGSLTRNFLGQWLQARDIESVNINAFAVMSRDQARDPEGEKRRERFRELRRRRFEELSEDERKELDGLRDQFRNSFGRFRRFELNGDLRRAMRRETEMAFEHLLKEDRSLLELLDADYAFLNGRLAQHYGIEGVEGDDMRLVELPADSPRGGILTQASILAVTSNPDRTSPVKRGKYILENILGTPTPPPPPDIPPLEDSAKEREGHTPSLREALAIHREAPLCSSCHNRMDPLGLAFENFNALGLYRDKERGEPIDSTGMLITGEPFGTVSELKQVLVRERRGDFYRCVTEKLLIYALGRGLEYSDVETVDRIVDQLEKEDGRPSALILGIIHSAPLQKRRRDVDNALSATLPASRDNEESVHVNPSE